MRCSLRLLARALALCLAAEGCAGPAPAGDPDVTYEITGTGSGEVWLRYLKATRPGDGGKLKAAEAQKNARPPFTADVRLGESWPHAWIEAKTEPVDRTVKLHCVLKHNGAVLTEGDGLGFVSCRARSGGGAAPPAPVGPPA